MSQDVFVAGVGMTGIPIVNVNNNCSSGSTALFLARQAVASGAIGLAQCYELTHQLRRPADQRQVPGARLALQHNLGLGGNCTTLDQSAPADSKAAWIFLKT